MGEIHLARLTGAANFEKHLVIKKILPHLARHDEFVRKFVDEAHILVHLTHGNIVTVFDMGEANGELFMAMEYVAGRDLRAVMRHLSEEGRTLPVPLIAFIVAEMSKGLSYAHRKTDDHGHSLGIIHRDISPSNILISREGEVKLADFGIAKAALRNSQSITGRLQGKFNYMSPEQARGEALDPRADLFSVGVVFYEMLTGTRPFEGPTDMATLERIKTYDPPPVSTLFKDFPPAIDDILKRLLAKDRNERFESADALLHALNAYLVEVGEPINSATLANALAPCLASAEAITNGGLGLDEALAFEADRLLAHTPSERTPSLEPLSQRTPAQASALLDPATPAEEIVISAPLGSGDHAVSVETFGRESATVPRVKIAKVDAAKVADIQTQPPRIVKTEQPKAIVAPSKAVIAELAETDEIPFDPAVLKETKPKRRVSDPHIPSGLTSTADLPRLTNVFSDAADKSAASKRAQDAISGNDLPIPGTPQTQRRLIILGIATFLLLIGSILLVFHLSSNDDPQPPEQGDAPSSIKPASPVVHLTLKVDNTFGFKLDSKLSYMMGAEDAAKPKPQALGQGQWLFSSLTPDKYLVLLQPSDTEDAEPICSFEVSTQANNARTASISRIYTEKLCGAKIVASHDNQLTLSVTLVEDAVRAQLEPPKAEAQVADTTPEQTPDDPAPLEVDPPTTDDAKPKDNTPKEAAVEDTTPAITPPPKPKARKPKAKTYRLSCKPDTCKITVLGPGGQTDRGSIEVKHKANQPMPRLRFTYKEGSDNPYYPIESSLDTLCPSGPKSCKRVDFSTFQKVHLRTQDTHHRRLFNAEIVVGPFKKRSGTTGGWAIMLPPNQKVKVKATSLGFEPNQRTCQAGQKACILPLKDPPTSAP